ncbi:hypothetical protein ISF_00465 [Cordyceps fumosorosea ARSEF 2679]|uniref:Uncharacterized protein n=1 Tax=Cordyceps fumosorosea (strain ARSEF 2679) TaxID=1081104 RepID=A0A162LP24_CORFA|nr:hypothetical protein ISF_00465 [Cordyceps fumosorosea ARSEF 2679]OAA73564.1 hypothetical protein ISF_00465 [Cordyceps fumosorosea ARSEF 2679]
MPRLANLAALLAAVAPALTTAALSDGQYTETIGPQELGSTTIDGTMVYSMNHCSIVHSTQCHTSLSTAGPAPTTTGSAPGYSSSSSSEPPAPSYGQPDTSSDASSVPTTTTDGAENTTTPGPEESVTTGTGTTTTTTEEAATSTSKVPDVPTGAAVMGAPAILGNVLVAAALAAVAV